MIIDQGTVYVAVFFMADSTAPGTGKPSLTPTATLSKAGGAWAAADGAVAEIGGAGNGAGFYSCTLAVTDTDTEGELWIKGVAAGALDGGRFVGQVRAVGIGKLVNDAITGATVAASAITPSEAPNLDVVVSSRATPADVAGVGRSWPEFYADAWGQ